MSRDEPAAVSQPWRSTQRTLERERPPPRPSATTFEEVPRVQGQTGEDNYAESVTIRVPGRQRLVARNANRARTPAALRATVQHPCQPASICCGPPTFTWTISGSAMRPSSSGAPCAANSRIAAAPSSAATSGNRLRSKASSSWSPSTMSFRRRPAACWSCCPRRALLERLRRRLTTCNSNARRRSRALRAQRLTCSYRSRPMRKVNACLPSSVSWKERLTLVPSA